MFLLASLALAVDLPPERHLHLDLSAPEVSPFVDLMPPAPGADCTMLLTVPKGGVVSAVEPVGCDAAVFAPSAIAAWVTRFGKGSEGAWHMTVHWVEPVDESAGKLPPRTPRAGDAYPAKPFGAAKPKVTVAPDFPPGVGGGSEEVVVRQFVSPRGKPVAVFPFSGAKVVVMAITTAALQWKYAPDKDAEGVAHGFSTAVKFRFLKN